MSGENEDDHVYQTISDGDSQHSSQQLQNIVQMEEKEKFMTVKSSLDAICNSIDTTKEEVLCIKVNLSENRCDVGGSQMGNKFLELHTELVQKFFSFCNDTYKGVSADEIKEVQMGSIYQDSALVHIDTIFHGPSTDAKDHLDILEVKVEESPEEVLEPCKKVDNLANGTRRGVLEKKAEQSPVELLESCKKIDNLADETGSGLLEEKAEQSPVELLESCTKVENLANKTSSGYKDRKRKSECNIDKNNSVKKIKMINESSEKNNEESSLPGQRKSTRLKDPANILLKAALRKANLNDTTSTDLSRNSVKSTVLANFDNDAKSNKFEKKKQTLDEDEIDENESNIESEGSAESEDEMFFAEGEVSSEENDDIPDGSDQKPKKNNKIQCTECGKNISQKQYPKHLRNVHKKLNAFKCEICHKNFNSAHGVNRHIKKSQCTGSKSDQFVSNEKSRESSKPQESETACRDHTSNDHENHLDVSNDNSNLDEALEKHVNNVIKGNPDSSFEKKDFTCHLCLKHMRTEEGLAKHLLDHDRDKFQCRVCDKYFLNRSRLKVHERTHNPAKHVCNVCSVEFTQGRYLIYHMRKNHAELRSACYECGILFDNLVDRNKHMLTHLSQHCSNYICPKCGKTFELMRYLKIHNKTCHNGTEKVCNICCEFFDTKEELNKHKWEHRVDFSYMCSICKMSFETPEILTSHLKTEHNSHMYVCESCGKEFNSSVKFKKHIAFEHNPDSLFSCEICDSKFMYAAKLKLHYSVHGADRPFQCEECGMCFKHNSTLKKHILRHNGDNMMQCEFCSAKFSSSEGLNNHFLDHHSEQINVQQLNFRVYECEYCGKRSSQKATHIRHLRSHTGEKPYTCKFCDKKFPIPAAMNRHIKRKHTNDAKRFSCETCGVKFFDNSHLTRHFKSRSHQQKINSIEYIDEITMEDIPSEYAEVKVDSEEMKVINLDPDKISVSSQNNEHVYTIEDSSLLNFADSTIYVIAEADGSDIEYVQLQSEHVEHALGNSS